MNEIVETIYELVLSQVVQTKSKSRNKFNFFRIMAIIHGIDSCSYELKNIFLNCRETVRITKARIQFIPFRDARRKEEAVVKTLFYSKNGSVVYSPCSICCTPYRN